MGAHFSLLLLVSSPHTSVTKLAGLFIKTLAKPLSKRIKHEFSRYEFTQGILIGIGQTTHSITSRLTIMSAGYKVRSIKPLEEEAALKAGAEFVGEGFLLLVSLTLLMYEYNSSNAKAAQKAAEHRAQAAAERQELQDKLHAIDVRLKALETYVKSSPSLATTLGVGERYHEPEEAVVSLELKEKVEEVVPEEAAKKKKEEEGDVKKDATVEVSSKGVVQMSGWGWRWPPWGPRQL